MMIRRRLIAPLAIAACASGLFLCGCGTTVIQGSPATQNQQTVTETVGQNPPPPPAKRSPSRGPRGLRSCGGVIRANAHTSCPFAQTVYQTVAGDNGSAQGTYDVYSSVTGQSYSMTCSFEQSTQMVCRGGNGAVVSWPG